MAYITKEYLENNIKNYDQYRKLDKEGKANGIATLDANGKLSNNQIPVLPTTKLAVADNNSATDNAAVSSGPVYINTYDVTPGEPTPRHNNAISIAGKNGISVTADNSGKIEIAGHEKPANLGNKTGEGLLIPSEPESNQANVYLRGDGLWSTPVDTTISFRGVRSGNKGNYTYSSIGADNNSPVRTVRSLIAGASMTLILDNNGNLTINGPDVPSPFYEEDTNDHFIFTIEDYTVDGVAKIGLSITCPSDVVFAQLDLPVTLPSITTPLLATVQSTKVNNKQTLSIQSSAPEAGFTPGKTSYAYLRFTRSMIKDSLGNIIVDAHTYNATIAISYKSSTQSYSVHKVF